MPNWLKQATAVTIKFGPFLDDGDGKTPETALTINQADVRLSKNGGNFAQKNESSACTHDELGYYDCALDVTDTGTVGRLKVVASISGAFPVWHEYMIVPANVYDSLVGGTDLLEVELSGLNDLDSTEVQAACAAALSAASPFTAKLPFIIDEEERPSIIDGPLV